MELYSTETNLGRMLTDVAQTMLATDERPLTIKTVFGEHGMHYDFDEDGDGFVTIGFNLPDGVFAEIDGGTYGQLQGFRIYLGDKDDTR